MRPKLLVGHYLGYHARTGALLVITTEGIVHAAGLRRASSEERWGGPEWSRLAGVPWDARGVHSVSEEDGKVAVEAAAVPFVPVAVPLPSVRRRYVTKADLRRFGATIGCQACAEISATGATKKIHTEECRSRIEAMLRDVAGGPERLEAHKRRREEAEAAREEVAVPRLVVEPVSAEVPSGEVLMGEAEPEEIAQNPSVTRPLEAEAEVGAREVRMKRQGEKRILEGGADSRQASPKA
eukprot:6118997-Amphidinium_carterae.1